MTLARRATSAVCAVAAVAAAVGAVVLRRGFGGDDAAVSQKMAGVAEHARTVAVTALESRKRALEAEVERAAGVPQLRAALADGVDAATMLDLFETEDWWVPYRTRGSALVSGNRLLAVRGDKKIPLPEPAVLARAQEIGVASAILVGVRPLIGAVAPLGAPGKGEPTFLVFAASFDASELEAAVGAPVLISDGQVALAASGAEKSQTLLRGVVGQERAGTAGDPGGGWQAVAVPVSAGIWLWVLQGGTVEAQSGPKLPIALGGAALLFGLAAFALGRRGARGGVATARQAPAATEGTTSPGRGGGGGERDVADLPAERKRRGTLPYDTGDPGRRATALPDSDVGPRASPGGTPRLAQAAVSSFVAERSRVEPGSNNFGRYRLIDRLGEGGMAEIYTAVSHGAEGFRRVFVLKRLRPEIARNRSAVDQFIDEAKLGSSLVHSNIVPVFDFGKVGDEYFMAQEYIIGRDMIRLLERHVEKVGRPLDEKLVLYVAHEVLEALAYAHNQTDATGKRLGLVHRDVSPGNVMLSSRGEVKLADFGIVKAEGRLSTTDVGVVKGNVSFMSPEQARGQAVDARSDLFSLGLVMYYCLTNDPLYLGEGAFDQLMIAAGGPRTEHLRRVAVLPPIVAAILERALSVTPAGRYQSAAEFAAELAPHIAGAKSAAAALMLSLFGEDFRKESSTLF